MGQISPNSIFLSESHTFWSIHSKFWVPTRPTLLRPQGYRSILSYITFGNSCFMLAETRSCIQLLPRAPHSLRMALSLLNDVTICLYRNNYHWSEEPKTCTTTVIEIFQTNETFAKNAINNLEC